MVLIRKITDSQQIENAKNQRLIQKVVLKKSVQWENTKQQPKNILGVTKNAKRYSLFEAVLLEN